MRRRELVNDLHPNVAAFSNRWQTRMIPAEISAFSGNTQRVSVEFIVRKSESNAKKPGLLSLTRFCFLFFKRRKRV